jgi:hypothetical protein
MSYHRNDHRDDHCEEECKSAHTAGNILLQTRPLRKKMKGIENIQKGIKGVLWMIQMLLQQATDPLKIEMLKKRSRELSAEWDHLDQRQTELVYEIRKIHEINKDWFREQYGIELRPLQTGE